MAYHFNDNVYTKFFTPREYQVELLDAAKHRNIIVCLGSGAGKIFIATKLIQELASVVRKPWRGGGKRTLYVVDSATLVAQQASYIRHLTDLTVGEYNQNEEEEEEEEVWSFDWESEFQKNQVLVMTSSICLQVFHCNFLTFTDVNLIIFDECHRAHSTNHPIQQIMQSYDKYVEQPRILGLTAPLLNNTCDPGRLEGEIRRLEISLHSCAETASDIVTVLRYCAKPKEWLVEFGLPVAGNLDFILEAEIKAAMNFISDHRYDPSEVYDEEFQEELQGIPDPKVDPIKILNDFLDVLHTLGPWCADRAALVLLIHLEKLKVKTPYERHFLLLCMVSSVFVKIRAICDNVFQEYEERERIFNFSSPKVLRLLEVLKQFKPTKVPEIKPDTAVSSANILEIKAKVDNSVSLTTVVMPKASELVKKEVLHMEDIPIKKKPLCVEDITLTEEAVWIELKKEVSWVGGTTVQKQPLLIEDITVKHEALCTEEIIIDQGMKTTEMAVTNEGEKGDSCEEDTARKKGCGVKLVKELSQSLSESEKDVENKKESILLETENNDCVNENTDVREESTGKMNEHSKMDNELRVKEIVNSENNSGKGQGDFSGERIREKDTGVKLGDELPQSQSECEKVLESTNELLLLEVGNKNSTNENKGDITEESTGNINKNKHEKMDNQELVKERAKSENNCGKEKGNPCEEDATQERDSGVKLVKELLQSQNECEEDLENTNELLLLEVRNKNSTKEDKGDITEECTGNINENEHDKMDNQEPVNETAKSESNCGKDERGCCEEDTGKEKDSVKLVKRLPPSQSVFENGLENTNISYLLEMEKKKSTHENREGDREDNLIVDEQSKMCDQECVKESVKSGNSSGKEGVIEDRKTNTEGSCEVGFIEGGTVNRDGDDELTKTSVVSVKEDVDIKTHEDCESNDQDSGCESVNDNLETVTVSPKEGSDELYDNVEKCLLNSALGVNVRENTHPEHSNIKSSIESALVSSAHNSLSLSQDNLGSKNNVSKNIEIVEDCKPSKDNVENVVAMMSQNGMCSFDKIVQISDTLSKESGDCEIVGNKGPKNTTDVEEENSEVDLGIQSVAAERESPNEIVRAYVPRSYGRGRGPRYNKRFRDDPCGKTTDVPYRHYRNLMHDDADALCGIVFVENRFTAKILYHLLNEIRRCDENYSFLGAQYTVDKVADPLTDPREAEVEHRKQEEVLKRFRMRDCNLLVGTSVLEEGIDIPKCNLVVLFDPPSSYRSYVQCKGRARAQEAHFVLLVAESALTPFVHDLAQYYEIERMLLRKCANREPPESEELEADKYTDSIEAYVPPESPNGASVNMATAVALVNRYCAKLPSDTFTRLTPLCFLRRLKNSDTPQYICTLRLPINSPVKQDILGLPMPSRVLARRIAALEACRLLHKAQELDDNLLPVGKEGFRVPEEEDETTIVEEIEEMAAARDASEPRPGTTKRRQYYYKRIADALTDCRPTPGQPSYLYSINMVLTCPLPEEQNTRGRKIYPPEDSFQGFGILTLKPIPKICPFPIYTRSGEVRVTLGLAEEKVTLTEEKVEKIVAFLNYTFTSVLRLQKYLMMFDPQASENSYFIIPTKKGERGGASEVDWDFLERIYENRDLRPRPVPQEERVNFQFDAAKYRDAVIMPWYRNQDQPQYFYVAEICSHLNPKSTFPGSEYKTFDEYYFKKYNIQIQNSKQPLLDVDHTSARLNFLTPRYVNRKGVALPTSSEETKRAKRENLEQKQILVPELCTVHPFPGSLWRKAVCLPCVLYRINALLLADQIRCHVAASVGLGRQRLASDFEWPPLDFGWTLADVLKKSKENAAKNMIKEKGETNVEGKTSEGDKEEGDETEEKKEKVEGEGEEREQAESEEKEHKKSANEILTEEEKKLRGNWMEIGTWSNEMANQQPKQFDLPIDDFDPHVALPPNLTLLGEDELAQIHTGRSDWGTGISARRRERVRYGSPTSWMTFSGPGGGFGGLERDLEGFETDDSYSEAENDFDLSDSSEVQGRSGLRIEFKSENVAEAVEDEEEAEKRERRNAARTAEESGLESCLPWDWDEKDAEEGDELEVLCAKFQEQFEKATKENEEVILQSEMLLRRNEALIIVRKNNQGNQIPNVFMEVKRQELNRTQTDLVQNLTKNQTADFIAGSKIIFLSLKRASYESVEQGVDSGYSEDELSRTPKTEPLGSDSEEDIAESQEKERSYEGEVEGPSFSFDAQPDLEGHPGPSPSIILQALTMSNANDGINLERLETIGDSFLKYAITTYLYCTYENINEGKLSYLRSKQVSNLNLYRLGRRKVFGESMIATKFEPHDNWLPPCYYVPRELEQALIEAGVPASHWNRADLPALREMSREEICAMVRERGEQLRASNEGEEGDSPTVASALSTTPNGAAVENLPCFIPYNLITQHSIPDKSVADCVEALIGAYLIACGPRGALLFMAWLGIRVLPKEEVLLPELPEERVVGSLPPVCEQSEDGTEVWKQIQYGTLKAPHSPLLRNIENPEAELERLLDGYEGFEQRIGYRFRDRSYLLQAMSHASYSPNRLTDCYQRLEFLGDAVLDYLITRHLYEDSRQHSPGALTDLRSALVNNTIFASLAVRHGFHKFFRHLSPGLNDVVDRFVRIQEENGHTISEEYYLIEEEECEEAEDVEVPKALGDVFESVAGAILLDSNMSLDAVWRVYYQMMKAEIEQFSTNVPKSPIRELLELEPETAKFGKPEKLADGRRVRVTVEVFGKGTYKGIGRNYRIAKCTAAKCALKQLKKKGLLSRKM